MSQVQELPGSNGPSPSSAHSSGVGQFDQSHVGACIYPPESDIPFSQEHYSVTERIGPLSESEDDEL